MHADEVHQLDGIVVADVVEPVGRERGRGIGIVAAPRRVGLGDMIGGAHHALDDVVDVGEVARVLAVVEHVDRLAGEDLLA